MHYYRAVSTDAPQPYVGGQRIAGSEKRRDPRIGTHLYIWCETDWLTAKGRVVNFSRGGLFVEAAYELTEGTRLLVSYQDSDGSFVAAPAEVVWHRLRSQHYRSGMGLRFLDVEKGLRIFELLSFRSNKSKPNGIWSFE